MRKTKNNDQFLTLFHSRPSTTDDDTSSRTSAAQDPNPVSILRAMRPPLSATAPEPAPKDGCKASST